MRLDAILEPSVGHPNRLALVIPEQPVVPAVLVARQIDSALQELAVADDL